jgi:hypothetical protein
MAVSVAGWPDAAPAATSHARHATQDAAAKSDCRLVIVRPLPLMTANGGAGLASLSGRIEGALPDVLRWLFRDGR